MTAAVVGGGGGGRAGVAHLRRRAEATVGAHALATVTERSGTQLDVRLDKKGAVVGRVHLSELADLGTAAAFPTAKSFHVVVPARARARAAVAPPALSSRCDRPTRAAGGAERAGAAVGGGSVGGRCSAAGWRRWAAAGCA